MKSGKIFWGLALVLCALCIIFNQFGILGEFGFGPLPLQPFC